MSAPCLSSSTLREFLAGRLPIEVEQAAAEHLECCERCESVAAQLSDDPTARCLAAASASRPALTAGDLAEVDDLCRRMYAVDAYQRALEHSSHTDSAATDSAADTEGDALHAASAAAVLAAPGGPQPRRLGHYELQRVLGTGAFGIVYLARDVHLNRQVALKVARTSILDDPETRTRFFREAEALARLEHLNIVPVFEAGEAEGVCYVALAYCDGPTLHAWLKDHPGPHEPRVAVRLMLPLVAATEHAHSRGIVHRDIKPGNILLPATVSAESPSHPKLTDFGLAKLVEHPTNDTLAGIIMGTPYYMAPEQAAGHVERIGPATDVYSLGTVLYELLTGRVPIMGSTMIDTLRRVLIDEPAAMRSLAGRVSEDLEAIVRKCLQKSPSQRYGTARELAEDLQRFLSGQPTKARPLGAAQRLLRFTKRHKTLVPLLLLAASVVGLSLGVLLYAEKLSESERAMQQAVKRLGQAEEHVQFRERLLAQEAYARDVASAGKATSKGDIPSAVAALKRQLPAPGQPDLRSLSWHYLWAVNTQQAQAFVDSGTEIYHLCLSPSGQELAAVGKDGWLRLYDATGLSLRSVMPTGQVEANCTAYASSGLRVATAGDDGTIRVIDLAARAEVLKIAAHAGKVYGVLFFDNDTKLVSCGNEPVIRLWDAVTGVSLGTLAGHTGNVEAIGLSRSGDRLVSASSDRTAVIWNLASHSAERVLRGHSGTIMTACFSPNGRWVATGANDHTIAIWDASRGTRLTTEPLLDTIQSVAFAPNSTRLYVGDRGGSVHCYQVVSGARRAFLRPDPRRFSWQAHSARIWHGIAGADPNTHYSAGKDHFVRRWDDRAPVGADLFFPADPDELFVDLEFSADGELLLVLSESRGLSIFDANTLQPLRTLDLGRSEWRSLRVLGERPEVAVASARGAVTIWDFQQGELRHALAGDAPEIAACELAASADGTRLAISSPGRDAVRIYDTLSGTLATTIQVGTHYATALSPDGRFLALDSLDDIILYDLRTERLMARLRGHTASVRSMVFSSDGTLLASGSADRTVRLWSIAGELLATITGHLADISEVRFTPNGRTLVSIDDRGRAEMAHVATRQTLFELPLLAERLRGLAITPDNRRLAMIRTLRGQQELIVTGSGPQP